MSISFLISYVFIQSNIKLFYSIQRITTTYVRVYIDTTISMYYVGCLAYKDWIFYYTFWILINIITIRFRTRVKWKC